MPYRATLPVRSKRGAVQASCTDRSEVSTGVFSIGNVERPLTRLDLSALSERWNVKTKYSGFVTFLVSLLTSVFLRRHPHNWLLQDATFVEDLLNNRHILEHWNRFVVLIYETKSSAS